MTTINGSSYTIKEVVDLMGVSAHTLRYYEKIGLLTDIQRHENGHRRYSDEDLGWVDFLKLLREAGMPIHQMQQFMAFAREGDGTIADRAELLQSHRTKLAADIAELQEHLEHLDRKIDKYNRMLDDLSA